jgi:hypothetical protein
MMEGAARHPGRGAAVAVVAGIGAAAAGIADDNLEANCLEEGVA